MFYNELMVRRIFVFIILIFVGFSTQAQMINNALGNAFESEDYFNHVFIKKNKIKHIHGKIQTKKKLSVIHDVGLTVDYFFNADGRLIKLIETYISDGNLDTIYHGWKYNNDKLEVYRRSDFSGYSSYHYTYNENGKIKKIAFFRDENSLNSKGKFQMKNQVAVSAENQSFQKINDTLNRIDYFNSYERKYKSEEITYNKSGYLKNIVTNFTVSNTSEKVMYDYNKNGLVSQKINTANLFNIESNRTTNFAYDRKNNLTNCNYYKNEKHTYSLEVLYNSNFTVDALLRKDIRTGTITITKFTYSFF